MTRTPSVGPATIAAFTLLSGCGGLQQAPAAGPAPVATIGIDSRGYFIDTKARSLDDFFAWSQAMPSYVIAHRGGGFLPGFPENAIESMQHTTHLAPTLLEIDVQRTRDGVFVLNHDPTLERTTTGKGTISELVWADLANVRLVDVNGDSTEFAITTLRDALIWGDDRVLFALDLKSDAHLDELVALIAELDAEDDALLFADSVEQAARAYRLNSELHFAILVASETLDDTVREISSAGMALAKFTGFSVVASPEPALNEALHKHGMTSLFGAFIVEHDITPDAATTLYRSLRDAGYDGISTNRVPVLALALGYAPVANESFH